MEREIETVSERMRFSCGWVEQSDRCLRLDCRQRGPCSGFSASERKGFADAEREAHGANRTDAEEARELERVLAKPLAEFHARNAAKNAAGFDTLDPTEQRVAITTSIGKLTAAIAERDRRIARLTKIAEAARAGCEAEVKPMPQWWIAVKYALQEAGLTPPVDQVADLKPLILYFPTEADRAELMAVAKSMFRNPVEVDVP